MSEWQHVTPILDYVSDSQPLVMRATWALGMDSLGLWTSNFPATVWLDKVIHVFGNFDGGEVVWEGANDNTHFLRLEHLRFPYEDIVPAGITPAMIRPKVLHGTGETAVTAILVGRKP